MNKISILETAQAIIDMANEIESLKTENVNLRDRLIHAQSETLAAIQQNEPKPEPRDIGHENVVSFVTRKSGELQVSPGIVWGLVMDLIAKNPDHFGTDDLGHPDPTRTIDVFGREYPAPSCDKIFGTAAEVDEHKPKFKIGDRIQVVNDSQNPDLNGKVYTVRTILNTGVEYCKYLYEVRENILLRFYENEIDFV